MQDPADTPHATSAAGPRIGIDASSIVGSRTGVGHATTELINALAAQWPATWPPFCAWVNSPRHEIPPGEAFLTSPHVRVHQTRWPGRLLLRGWQYLKWPPIERFTGPVDLVHSPASYFPPARAARRVMTVHDLYFHHAPGHVEPYGGAYFAQTFRHSLPQAAHIIAISQFTRQELLRFYTMPEDRISVIPQGVDCTRFRPEPQADDTAQLERLGIEKPYLLSVATIEPRKNLVTLIEAYARARQILRAAHQRLPRLVIVGLHGWGLQALKERLYEARLDSGEVHLTGYVPDAALPALYRHAFGLVFPSLYEGFGMPVLEAMASGCPTAVANTSALPEVGGEAAAYFNPRDSDALARLLARFLGDPLLRQNLREAGFARAAQFSWQATARATLDVYRHVLSI